MWTTALIREKLSQRLVLWENSQCFHSVWLSVTTEVSVNVLIGTIETIYSTTKLVLVSYTDSMKLRTYYYQKTVGYRLYRHLSLCTYDGQWHIRKSDYDQYFTTALANIKCESVVNAANLLKSSLMYGLSTHNYSTCTDNWTSPQD